MAYILWCSNYANRLQNIVHWYYDNHITDVNTDLVQVVISKFWGNKEKPSLEDTHCCCGWHCVKILQLDLCHNIFICFQCYLERKKSRTNQEHGLVTWKCNAKIKYPSKIIVHSYFIPGINFTDTHLEDVSLLRLSQEEEHWPGLVSGCANEDHSSLWIIKIILEISIEH